MHRSLSRRRFLAGSAAAAAGLALPSRRAFARRPADRLGIGVIGVAGRGGANLDAVSRENVLALCDVDENNLAGAAARFPKAGTFVDYREMLELEGLDAVVVSAPDHSHAPPAIRAMKKGLHVYCEKPLAHTVAEARRMAELASEKGLVTQMGTQIHAGDNYRRVVELIRAGAIGPVSEVHVWCGKTWSGGERPTDHQRFLDDKKRLAVAMTAPAQLDQVLDQGILQAGDARGTGVHDRSRPLSASAPPTDPPASLDLTVHMARAASDSGRIRSSS